jgi:NADH-quinone oxidoreductase subunit D
MKIIRQCIDRMADDGPINTSDVRFILPEKKAVYNTIEGTIAHFKIVMEGVKVPAGECYSFTEGGNGELGFFIVSDGSGTPYRVRCRPPCFYNLQACREMMIGEMVADIVPTFGSINMIGGECDR